jgi:MFS superfamily sulfate permease-like transporter
VDTARLGVLFRQTLKRNMPLSLAQSYAVMLLVAGVTVFVSLALAIAIGTLVAMILFIRSNCKQPIRHVVHADRRTSRKVRPAAEAELLRAHGSRIALVELDGALFFGTAEAADERSSAWRVTPNTSCSTSSVSPTSTRAEPVYFCTRQMR